jgi:hypothetical protein
MWSVRKEIILFSLYKKNYLVREKDLFSLVWKKIFFCLPIENTRTYDWRTVVFHDEKTPVFIQNTWTWSEVELCNKKQTRLKEKNLQWFFGRCLRAFFLTPVKGGGIDGRVSPPDWDQCVEVLDHCTVTRRGCVCLGNVGLTRFVGFDCWCEELDSGMT